MKTHILAFVTVLAAASPAVLPAQEASAPAPRSSGATSSVLAAPDNELELVSKLFADDPEISVSSVGGKLVLSGSTANAEALKRVAQAVALNPSRIMSQVSYSPSALKVLVTDFLARSGQKSVAVNVIGHEVCLSGRMYDKGQIDALAARVKAFLADFPGVTVNVDALKVYKQKIMIGIEFLSYDVSRARDLGISLPDAVTATADLTYTLHDNLTGTIKGGGFTAALNLLKQNQVAKKLYSTTLSTQSGESAEFQNGGTIYKQTSDLYKSALTEIEYGYIIKAKPTIVDENTVNLEFDLDLRTPKTSTSTSTSTTGGDTDIARYQTKSKYIVRPGESILLSGFNQINEDQTRRGTPWFSCIPLIGSWFGNEATTRTTTEMLLAVTINWAVEDDTTNVTQRVQALRDHPVEIPMP